MSNSKCQHFKIQNSKKRNVFSRTYKKSIKGDFIIGTKIWIGAKNVSSVKNISIFDIFVGIIILGYYSWNSKESVNRMQREFKKDWKNSQNGIPSNMEYHEWIN